jgi:phosphoribosyl-ATP pyrophosphohydrolase
MGAKLMEEAAEVYEAAAIPDEKDRKLAVAYEAADLVYHLLVIMAHSGVTLADVEAELASRSGTSGLEEKRSRGRKSVTPPAMP